MMGKEFLLEIGTEEIPARFLPPVLEEMAAAFRKKLTQERIDVGEIVTWGTPRRLALVAQDLAEMQTEVSQEIIGPPKAVAYSADGKPTKALEGFAKAQGVAVAELSEVETPRGVYLAVKRRTPGQPAIERLKEILPEFILGLSFPKSMRWGSGKITFARPIHWILARFAGQVVPCTLGDVVSGGVTYGHRFLGPEPLEVPDAASYVTALRAAHVIVNPAERKNLLEKELNEAAAKVGGEVVPNPGLLEENTFLVEFPSVVCGHFEERFLELPEEVLITSMREHQRYFSLRGKDGRLLPHFIAVNNTLTRNPDVVRQGHEKVLRARLSDAMYFYQVDKKIPLKDRVEELKGVVFHSSLGTSYEKMQRFKALALFLGANITTDAGDLLAVAPEIIERAATLCKADIVTEMVGEFPSLQGAMGRQYAKISGEDPEVAEALFSHYLPRHADDILPEDLVGTIVGLADRLDTICGIFGVGLVPTGAADPYGLRRHALAVIRILRHHRLHLDLPAAVDNGLSRLHGIISRTPEETRADVLDFFKTRLQHLFLSEGYDNETVAAVLASSGRDVVEAADKIKALEEIRQSPDFPALAMAFKRVINISHGVEPEKLDESLFAYQAEKDLFKAADIMKKEVETALEHRDYAAAFLALAKLKQPVDAFFDNVLVMAEDPRIKKNRLGLLACISETFLRMADFSKIAA
uniref:Glycine--tRNA ligase beta subunit n=1 Tax=Desulfobacca acetoxidans TaxID=60893 RepID=A0A7V6DPS1_9BACT